MLHARTIAAIIMGVSECPRAPTLQPLPQCANSAADFSKYLLNTFGLPERDLFNLFDSDQPADLHHRTVARCPRVGAPSQLDGVARLLGRQCDRRAAGVSMVPKSPARFCGRIVGAW